ncbi:S41 family peptidase [Pseudoduganella sp. R-34]|uniref:S41 family peptidase n=1 Tax=unclassified Pseudoduganella TaxID=2637179 RepID=UPI003CE86412
MASLLICLPTAAVAAQADLPDMARIWRDVQYLHPALGDGTVDWDQALVDALPAMLAAQDDGARMLAIERLMQPLHDSALRIWDKSESRPLALPSGQALWQELPASYCLLRLHGGRPVSPADWAKFLAHLPNVRGLVIDLRSTSWQVPNQAPYLEQLAARVITAPLALPTEQYRFYADALPSGTADDGAAVGGLLTMNMRSVTPQPSQRGKPIVFIVDNLFPVPKVAVALQTRGAAQIIAVGRILPAYAVPLQHLNIGEHITVQFSRARLVTTQGIIGFRPNEVISAAGDGNAEKALVQAAIQMLKNHGHWRPAPAQHPAPIMARQHHQADQAEFPALEQRLLAAIKMWATIDRQYPYRELLGEAWNDALATCLQQMTMVSNSLEYAQALETMAIQMGDNHVWVSSRALNAFYGKGDLDLRFALIDGKVIATADSVGGDQAEFIRAGDELIAIDDQPISTRMAMLASRTSAATAAGIEFGVLGTLLRGQPASVARLKLLGARGEYEATLGRKAVTAETIQRASSPVLQRFEGRIAYVDLDRLEPDAVPAMFSFIADTSGVIFDLRGYPRSTALAIAARLNVKGAASGPGIHQFFGSGLLPSTAFRLYHPQPIRRADGPIYSGTVVVLIDARTMSQAEHAALLFESVAPVTFIGSPSVGTNGDLRLMTLPGKVTVSYSGIGITRANGTRLQQIGIQPHITVHPTVAGLRAQQDEVLERALLFLKSGR